MKTFFSCLSSLFFYFFPKKSRDNLDFSKFLGEESLPYIEAKNFNVANNGEIEEIPETTS